MADDANTPVLEEAPQPQQPEDANNRGNFTRNLNKEEDSAVARKMFFGGLLLLPWLHLVNVIFYRKQFVDATIDPQVTLCTFRYYLGKGYQFMCLTPFDYDLCLCL